MKDNEKNVRKYPREIGSIVRKQTLYIESKLSLAKSSEGNHPLHVYAKPFSRYTFTIINENKKAATANIPVNEIIHIARKAGYAEQKAMQTANNPAPVAGRAYTVRFKAGRLKGMTPAELLIKNPTQESVNELTGQINYLQTNIQKYPANSEVIYAIQEALDLFKKGLLKKENVSSQAIEIYKAELRALRSRQKNGMNFVYHISINWIPGNAYPVEIKIWNYYAPVDKLPDGRQIVRAKDRDTNSEIRNTMLLTGDEFMELIYAMQMNMRQFETIHAKEVWDDAMKLDYENRQSWQNNRTNSETYYSEQDQPEPIDPYYNPAQNYNQPYDPAMNGSGEYNMSSTQSNQYIPPMQQRYN